MSNIREISNLTNTAFGEVSTAESRPFIQTTAAYNLIPANFRTFTALGGSATAEGGLFKVSSGTGGLGAYGTIQSFRALNYKAGEGGKARFTGVFETNAALSWSGVGLFTIADELTFGYNGTDFGIWYRSGGLAEVRTLTITGAASGSETATITLNGTGYSVPLTSGTVQHNAYEIQVWFDANVSDWNAEQVDDTVIFCALSDSPKSGTYSLSSSTATGTIAQDTAGVTKTSTHIPQSQWNGQALTTTLDPSKGNVYQIKYQYLGFGNIFFQIEDEEKGEFITVHTIKYVNNNTTPSLSNPSMHLGLYATSIGTSTDIIVKCASMGAFVEGMEGKTRNPRAEKNTNSSVGNNFVNILSIRNSRTYNGKVNQQEVQPLELSIASESTKNLEIEIRGNAVVDTVDRNWQNVGTNLIVDVDKSACEYLSGGRLLFAKTLPGGGGADYDLDRLRIRIPPTLEISIFARVTGGGASSTVTAALAWYEDL